jgi:hypothetical protein
MSIIATSIDPQQRESPHGRRQGDSDAIRSSGEATLMRAGQRRRQPAETSYSNTSTASMVSTSSLVKMTHLHSTRPQKTPPDPDTKAISRSIIVNGTEHVVSYGGTSQYNRDGAGASACGLAALNFARVVFSMEQGGLQDTALLQAVLTRECAEVRQPIVFPYPITSLSKGNHCYMRIVVWKPSSRSRRHMPRSLV